MLKKLIIVALGATALSVSLSAVAAVAPPTVPTPTVCTGLNNHDAKQACLRANLIAARTAAQAAKAAGAAMEPYDAAVLAAMRGCATLSKKNTKECQAD